MTATFQKDCVYGGRGICNMGHKDSSRKRARSQELRVTAVRFVPTPGVETRLTRVYDLLLRERPDEAKDEPEDVAPGDDTSARDDR